MNLYILRGILKLNEFFQLIPSNRKEQWQKNKTNIDWNWQPNQNELKWHEKSTLFHHCLCGRVSGKADESVTSYIKCETHLLYGSGGVTFAMFGRRWRRKTKKLLDFSHQAYFMGKTENCENEQQADQLQAHEEVTWWLFPLLVQHTIDVK